ncbi:MAG: ATP-dependent helicase [Terriglobia bacterium]
MSDPLDQLNPEQREAVECTEGPLLILAGAGSGKTRVITHRIAHLIQNLAVPPEGILAVTFTNKAADQMRERVRALLAASDSGVNPHISTFHSFCVRVLRGGIERIGYGRGFSIYDEDDQQRIIRAAMKELGVIEEVVTPRAAASRISHAKNREVAPAEMYRLAADPVSEKLALIYERYEKMLRAANALDFDDLLLKTVELFATDAALCEDYNRYFTYLMVDEYQDTNRIQYQLIRQLTQVHQNICVVGDEDQSIYRWRGADIENILNFEKDFPSARVIRLEQNYRSTQVILDAASAVVSHNKARIGKKLWSERREGKRLEVFEAADADAEADFIAQAAREALAAGGAVGVLYRTNAQSRALEEALRREDIAYQLVGGFGFYERAEIKDALAYARLALNPRDSAALLRIINTPPRGIGPSTVSTLQAEALRSGSTLWETVEQALAGGALPLRAKNALGAFRALVQGLMKAQPEMPLSEFFKSILDRTGYLSVLEAEGLPESQGRIENLQELVNAAAEAEERGETLSEFLDHAALVSDSDEYSESSRVTLMTLHTAKGLEFSTVIMAGMEEGLFPHKLSLAEQAAIEEERRLCYVGMTRAKSRLILTRACRRRAYAEQSYRGTRPSRFLAEVPLQLRTEPFASAPRVRREWQSALNSPELIEGFLRQRAAAPAASFAHTASAAAQGGAQRWKRGARVRHPKYGAGTVIDCEGEGDNTKLTVSFPGYGRKKLVERYASLERA